MPLAVHSDQAFPLPISNAGEFIEKPVFPSQDHVSDLHQGCSFNPFSPPPNICLPVNVVSQLLHQLLRHWSTG